MRARFTSCITLLLALLCAPADARSPELKVVAVNATFDDVRENVEDAILKRGFVIDYTAYIGNMLNRTAKDVGATRRIYDKALTVQFCSSVLSRRMMEADPANIGFCPYVVFLYTLEGQPSTTYVGYRNLPLSDLPAERAAIEAVGSMLEAIAREAAGTR